MGRGDCSRARCLARVCPTLAPCWGHPGSRSQAARPAPHQSGPSMKLEAACPATPRLLSARQTPQPPNPSCGRSQRLLLLRIINVEDLIPRVLPRGPSSPMARLFLDACTTRLPLSPAIQTMARLDTYTAAPDQIWAPRHI